MKRPPSSTGVSAQPSRSEEHTSELQSQSNLVCRLLLEKKKKQEKAKVFNRQAVATANARYQSLDSGFRQYGSCAQFLSCETIAVARSYYGQVIDLTYHS